MNNEHQRIAAACMAIVLCASQLTLPSHVEASHLGSSTVSAGSVPPPGVSAIQSFQPDLFTGRATTSVPIAVPPGRKGMQPNLAITYSSSSRNSWIGVGWGLDVGYIERSTKNGVPKYNSSDTFSFMFQGVASDLVQGPGGTYRAKDEGLFLRFTNNGVSGWEVRDKSGTRYLFGQTAASQIEQLGSVFRWALDKVIDVNGNTLAVIYTKDRGQLYLDRIDYTGHEPTALAPSNQVFFALEARNDIEVSYRSGFAVTTAKRLKQIEVKTLVGTTPALVRRYDFTYAYSGRTNRSLLIRITHVGADGATALSPMEFAYQGQAAPVYSLMLNNPTTSLVGWNMRNRNWVSPNELCVPPNDVAPWSEPTTVTGEGSVNGTSVWVNADGSFSARDSRRKTLHAWTWVAVQAQRTITLSPNDGCFYVETPSTGIVQMWNGEVTLPAGWSMLHFTGVVSPVPSGITSPVISQVALMHPTQFRMPELIGDVDGNGTSDLIQYNAPTGTWTVSTALGGTPFANNPWLTEFGRSAPGGNPFIPVVGDWNADGRTDIAINNGTGWQFATSTGSAFNAGTIPPSDFGLGTPFSGDFNGDGIGDLGRVENGAWRIALGTGSGLVPKDSFSITFSSGTDIPLVADFNGDGLTDIGIVNGGTVSVALSNGTVFVPQSPAWLTGFGSANYVSADFNGDGLTDIAYYDKSDGRVWYAPSTGTVFGARQAMPFVFSATFRSTTDQVQVADFNGDGLADPAVFNIATGSAEIATASEALPDLLSIIHNGVGGSTAIQYQASNQLPFIIPLVKTVSVTDGLGHSYTTTYRYEGGLYDGPTREFRGFSRVEVLDVDQNVSITDFHQDEFRKGRPFHTEFRDAAGNLWTKSDQTWLDTQPETGVHFVKLDRAESTMCENGDASCRSTRSRFEYDSYGNVTGTYEDGEPSASGDERSTHTTFINDTANWKLGKPSTIETWDVSGVAVAKRRFVYDAIGHLTREEEWRNLPTEQWLATMLTYDTYGNVKTVTDALNRTTTNTYDASGTYLIRIANALGHTRDLAYDARFGQVISSTDQNGVTTTTEYDPLGRVTKVIGPNDNTTLPTLTYAYDLTTNPAKTTACARIQSNVAKTHCTYTFTDGLGRTIQTRSPAEDSAKQIVSGVVEFNAKGQVIKQYLPYLETSSASYVVPGVVTPNSELRTPNYIYDPLGRMTRVTDPDGSISSTSYDDWSVTVTDANSHMTRRTTDVYGRLATVEEFNGGQTYTTAYQYDTLGNLTRVTDAQGNVTTITYDSLGRKLSMNDPDMGVWSYVYDAVDNLTSQTDARGVVITFTYDVLNRLTRKDYSVPPASTIQLPAAVLYAYDDASKPYRKGKLSGITDGSGSSNFEYDNLGRLVTETKTIDGTPNTIHRTYDLLGRLTSLAYPDNDQALYTYNAQGGIETVSLQSPVSGLMSLVSNVAYNAAGQMTTITYGNGVTTDYSYNPQTLRLDSLIARSPNSAVLQDFSYQFDAGGNVTQITDRVHTGSQSFQYDPLNRLTQAQGAYGTSTYAYNAIGNLLDKEGVALSYGAGAAGPHAVTSTASGLTLTYDANGNLTRKSTVDSPQSIDLTAQDLMYDAENRLVEVKTAQEDTVSVTFQPGWNFFSLPVIPLDRSIARLLPTFAQDFGQISAFSLQLSAFSHYVGNAEFDDFTTLEYGTGYQVFCKASGPVTVPFTGKLPSQRLTKSLGAGWHLLGATPRTSTSVATWLSGVTYSAVKQLPPGTASLTTATQAEVGQAYWVQVTAASTWSPPPPQDPATQYLYDGDGGRVKQITSAGTTTFLGQSYEKAPDGTITKYVFAGDQRIAAKTSTGSLRFYHTDHLGSSNVITDNTGQLVELAEYTPYGSASRLERANAQTGQPANAFQFTGQRLDASTSLYFYNARYYDPQLGRFTQPDIYVQDPSDPQSLNRYTYVRNNPVNLTDPSGYGWKSFLKILAIVAIAVAVVATAGAALGAAPAVAAMAGEGVSLTAVASTAGGVAAGSMFVSSLLPGPSGGASPAAATAIMAGGAALASGSLVPAALLGSAALQAGVGYVGTTLLETPPAQQGIARLAGAFEGFGMAPAAAFLLSGALAGTAVFGALSAGIVAAGARGASEADIAYRALNARDAEQLAAGLGLEAKNPAGIWTAAEHIARGSSRAALANDPWIATTSDLNVARAFKSGNGIVKIDLSKVPGPKVRVWEYAPRLNGEAGIPYHRSIWHQETSIYRNIPRDAILDLVE